MNAWDAVGFVASGLVVGAFCMKEILHLRIVAVASNVAFFAYGIALGLPPVWLLHLVLLPVNLCRLLEASRHGGNRKPGPSQVAPRRLMVARATARLDRTS